MRSLVVASALVAGTACPFQHGSSIEAPPNDTRTSDTPEGDAANSDARASDGGAPPSFGFVQVASAEDTSSGSETVALTHPTVAGDLVVVFVGWYKAGAITSVTDSANDTFAIAAAPTTSATGMETQAVYYACGVNAAATTVTVAFQNANQDPDVRVAEYRGVATSTCVDDAVSATGSGTAVDSGALTTHGAHELLVAGNKVFYVCTSGDPTYMTRTITGYGDVVEDRVAAAAGNAHATATQNQAGAWVMQLVAFVGQ